MKLNHVIVTPLTVTARARAQDGSFEATVTGAGWLARLKRSTRSDGSFYEQDRLEPASTTIEPEKVLDRWQDRIIDRLYRGLTDGVYEAESISTERQRVVFYVLGGGMQWMHSLTLDKRGALIRVKEVLG